MNQKRRRCFDLLGFWGIAFCLVLFALLDLHAQSGVRKMIESRSLPDKFSTQALDKASNFSQQEMQMIEGRSVMNAQAEVLLERQSEFSAANLHQLSVRSEFSATEMQMLEKRSEPDVAMTKQIQKYSTPAARLLQKDQVVDWLFLNAVQKQSDMTPEEKRRLAKASDQTTISAELQRNSVAAESYLSKRSVPESAWQRLLRSRSVD